MLQTSGDCGERAKRGMSAYVSVVVAGFLTQVVLICCQRLPSISLESVRSTLNLSYSEIGLITSWFTVFYAGAAFVWGWLADRFGAKRALAVAESIAAAGLILFGLFAQYNYVLALVIWSVAGFGCAGLYMATIPKLVAKWFAPNKRGTAMGFIAPGGTVASIVLGVVAPSLVANAGWQIAFVCFGCFCAVVTLLTIVLVKDDPATMGLRPFGAPEGTQAAVSPRLEEEEAQKRSSKGLLIEVLKMGITWRFGLLFALYQLGYMTTNVYYVAAIQSAGFDTVQAGLGITFGGLFGCCCLVVYGQLCDRIPRKYVITFGCFAAAASAALYASVLPGNPPLALCYLFTALIIGFVGLSPAMLSTAGDCYPERLRGTGSGTVSTISIIGRYLGPWIAGMFVDGTGGNIAMAFWFLAVPLAVTALAALTLPKKPKYAV